MSNRFLVVCLNPTIQRTLVFKDLSLGQVNRARNQLVHASGKGVNATRVLQQLGAEVTHLTQVGGMSGEQFLTMCCDDHLKIESIPMTTGVRTCTTIIDETTSMVTELVEEGIAVNSMMENQLVESFRTLLKSHNTVLINGSKAPGFSESLFPEFVSLAKKSDCQVFLDFRGAELINATFYKPDWIKINLQECIATWFPDKKPVSEGEKVSLSQNELEVLLHLNQTLGIGFLITNGGQPALGVWNNTYAWFPVPEARGINPIGSGDSVLAGFSWALNLNKPVQEAITFGLECGRKNFQNMKPGSIL